MLRTRKARILSGAGLALAALAAVLTGPPAHAAISGDNFIVAGAYPYPSGCQLHAHAHDYPLQLDPCGDAASIDSQAWILVNPQKVGTQTAVELQLAGTDECANDSFYTVYLDSCVKGDANELFWARPAIPENTWYFVNAAASQRYGASIFLTAASFTTDSYVYDEPSGNGDRQEWYIYNSHP